MQSVRAEHYLGVPDSRVLDNSAFEEMRNYLIGHYGGLESQHSFVDANGSVFDCFPIEQQPALKGARDMPRAPDLTPADSEHRSADKYRGKRITRPNPRLRDQFGNIMFAPKGTFPMRRITIESVSKFKTLNNFFRKSPSDDVLRSEPKAEMPQSNLASGEHHAWAKYNGSIDNIGGQSFINIWKPKIKAGQIFSLSQQWYIGGNGQNLQTVEVGWQVYPQKYTNLLPVLFVFCTPDNYKTNWYNSETTGIFVHTNGTWPLGGALSSWSTDGGPQVELQIAVHHNEIGWWIYVEGLTSEDAIGYYPNEIFSGGALSARASGFSFGGEVAGTSGWSSMGSGQFAEAGYQHAAYQRDVEYFLPNGGTVVADDLKPYVSAPALFTVISNVNNPPWNQTIYFGGPGGSVTPEAKFEEITTDIAASATSHVPMETEVKHTRAKIGGTDALEANRLEALENENRKLKKLLVESMLEVATLKELLEKKS